MSESNRVQLFGNLGGVPELRYTAGGRAVANLSLATSERYTDPRGQPAEHTEWHMVRAWGALAERVAQLGKGASVLVIGRLRTEKWQDNGGVDRYTTRVDAVLIYPTSSLPSAAPGVGEGSR